MRDVVENIERRHARPRGSHGVGPRHTPASLIERIEPRHLEVSTMGDDVATWGHIDRAGHPGATVLETIGRPVLTQHDGDRKGRPPFRRAVGTDVPRVGARGAGPQVVQARARSADLLARREGLLPFDVPTEPFLDVTNVENAVRSPDKEDVPYEPWFDDYAVAYDLEPGDMPHWALNGLHRVENYDVLIVSLTTPELPGRPGGGAGPPAVRRARPDRQHQPRTV